MMTDLLLCLVLYAIKHHVMTTMKPLGSQWMANAIDYNYHE